MFPHATCMCIKSAKECQQQQQQRLGNKKLSETTTSTATATAASISTVQWKLNKSIGLIKVNILPAAQVADILKSDKRLTKAIEVNQVIKFCIYYT